MKIAVNARLAGESASGIPVFINRLYENLSLRAQCIQFRTNSNNGVFNLFYDLFLASLLIVIKKPDIFHGPSHILPLFKPRGVRFVLTVHDISFIKYPAMAGPVFRHVYTYLLHRSLKIADLIITDSQSTKNDLVSVFGTSSDKIRVIYLGISDTFYRTAKSASEISGNYILNISTHPIRKNYTGLIQAFTAGHFGRKFSLVIVGLTNIHSFGKIISLGKISQARLENLYKHATLFVYPSFYEGFGLPVLEAMASKVTVVAADTSSLPELMPDKRFLANPYDVDDIKNKMKMALSLSSAERRRILEGNYRFSQGFTWKKCADKYFSAFKEILKQK